LPGDWGKSAKERAENQIIAIRRQVEASIAVREQYRGNRKKSAHFI